MNCLKLHSLVLAVIGSVLLAAPARAVEPARTSNAAFSEAYFTVKLGPVINYFAPVPNLMSPEEYFRQIGASAQQVDEKTWRLSAGEYTTFAQAYQRCQDTGPVTVNPPIEDLELHGLAYAQVIGPPYQLLRTWSLSNRADVRAGESAMIGGISIPGEHPKVVVFRTNGPALAENGVDDPLENPRLTLIRNNFNVNPRPATLLPNYSEILSNDDWERNYPGTNDAKQKLNIGGGEDPKDALIATILDPGLYAAVVSGEDGSEGVALLEVYILDALNITNKPE